MIFSKPMILSVGSSAFGSTVFAFAEEFEKRQLDLIEKANALGSDGNAEEFEFLRDELWTFGGEPWTALYVAAFYSKPTAVAALLQARADVHEGMLFRRKDTPLHAAKTADCASILLAATADPARFDEYGRTPLHCAAVNGQEEKAKQLIEAKADVNLSDIRCGMTLLTWAVEQGNSKVVAVLLEADGLDWAKEISFLVRAEGPTAAECLEKLPKEALLPDGSAMERAHIQEQLRVILEQRTMGKTSKALRKLGLAIFWFANDEYITLGSQNLFTRPKVQASLKYIPCLFASDACNPELLKSLADTTNDEVFHTRTVAALVQAAWMQTRLATAGEVFVSLLMLPLLCHASFTLRHEQPHFAEPGH